MCYHLRFFFATCVLLVPTILFSQGWQWSDHFGGPGWDYGRIGAIDAAENVYCFGSYAGSGLDTYYGMYIGEDTLQGSRAGFVAKYASDGSLEWVLNCVSPTASFSLNAIVLDTVNDQLILAGGHSASGTIGSMSLPNSGAFIAKVSLEGDCLSAFHIGTESTSAFGLALDEQGNMYLTGLIGEFSMIGNEAIDPGTFIAKYDQTGTQLWAKELITEFDVDGTARFYPYQVRAGNANVMVHGIARQFPTSGAFEADTVQCEVVVGGGHALVALDALTGVARWMKPLGFSTTVYPNSIARRLMDVDPNGNTYCAATLMGDSGRFDTDTVLAVPAGGWVPYLAKYNSNGDLEMIRTYGPDTYLSAVDVTSDGTLLLLGGSNVGSDVDICDGDTGVFMVRVDSTGDCLGAVHVAYGAQGLSVEEAASGIYLTCGSTFPSGLPFTFAGDSFVGYDFSDVLLGKHSLNVGVGSFRAAENNALEIYANPNNGSFRLRIPDAFAHEQQLQLAVYDGAGRMVAQQPLVLDSDAPRLDLYGIGAGLYNVTLSNGERAYHGSMVVE